MATRICPPFVRIHRARRHRHRYAAAPDAQVHRRIKFRIIELVDHIRTDNPDLRRAMGDEGRNVECAHANDAHLRIVGGEQQRPAVVVKERGFGLDTRALHQRQRLVQYSSLGDCKDDAFGHDGAALGAGDRKGNMAIHAEILSGLNDQADHVINNGAPGTGAICRALIALAEGDSLCGKRIAQWDPKAVLKDALPLRIAGGFHDLFRRGIEPDLGKIYRGEITDQFAVELADCRSSRTP